MRCWAKNPGSERDIELFVLSSADERKRAGGPAIDDYVFSFAVKSDLIISEVRFRHVADYVRVEISDSADRSDSGFVGERHKPA